MTHLDIKPRHLLSEDGQAFPGAYGVLLEVGGAYRVKRRPDHGAWTNS